MLYCLVERWIQLSWFHIFCTCTGYWFHTVHNTNAANLTCLQLFTSDLASDRQWHTLILLLRLQLLVIYYDGYSLSNWLNRCVLENWWKTENINKSTYDVNAWIVQQYHWNSRVNGRRYAVDVFWGHSRVNGRRYAVDVFWGHIFWQKCYSLYLLLDFYWIMFVLMFRRVSRQADVVDGDADNNDEFLLWVWALYCMHCCSTWFCSHILYMCHVAALVWL